jgi:hypothetical protein
MPVCRIVGSTIADYFLQTRPIPTVIDPSMLVTGRETARQFFPFAGGRSALRSAALKQTCS